MQSSDEASQAFSEGVSKDIKQFLGCKVYPCKPNDITTDALLIHGPDLLVVQGEIVSKKATYKGRAWGIEYPR